MSTRSDLKENILAEKLEFVLRWIVANRGAVLTGGGILIGALLIGSVVVLKGRERRDVAVTRLAMAQSFVGQRQFERAAVALEELRSSSPDREILAQVAYHQGLASLGMAKFEDAAKYFQEAVDLSMGSPLRPLALSNLGFAQEEKKDFDAAVRSYSQFMAEYGEHFLAPRVQLSVGRSYASAGNIEEAKKALAHLIDLYPTSTWAENARSIMDKLKTR